MTVPLIPERWFPFVILATGPVLVGCLVTIGLIVGRLRYRRRINRLLKDESET